MYYSLYNQYIMLNIHILTSGESVHKVYQQVFRHYNVSRFILLTETSQHEKIQSSIEIMKTGCREINIPLEIITIEQNNIPELMEKIQDLRKKYPIDEAKLFFNITSGRKDIAIMTFCASLWVSGIAYYLPSETQCPLVFPAPSIPLSRLESNKLYQRILTELNKKTNTPSCQADLRAIIKENPNRNGKVLSGQTLSQAVSILVDAGLINSERNGRRTELSLTLAGEVAVSFLKSAPVSNMT